MEMFGARPTYFVARPDGTCTALVEVDQLPAWIQIAGISTNLPANDAYNMTCVGISERAPFPYIIDIIAAAAVPNNYPSSTTTANNNPTTTSGEARKKEQPTPSPPRKQRQLVYGNGEDNREGSRNGLSKNNKAQNIEIYRSKAAPNHSRAFAHAVPAPAPLMASASASVETPAPAVAGPAVIEIPASAPASALAPASASASIPATASAPAPAPAPAAALVPAPVASPPALKNTRPRIVPGTKRFCTYWIRTGGCDFMQQGCIYSHVMPVEETLKDIGFPDGYPKWYRNAMRRANKGSSRLAAKPKGRINKSKAAREEENVLLLRLKTDRNPTPLPRRIKPVLPTTTTTITTAQAPIAEPTSSSSSPPIPDLFSSPLIPLSWQSNDDMPALQPVKIVNGVVQKNSQGYSKYVQIRLPEPKHCYLFEEKGG